jgi:hypothetical protein
MCKIREGVALDWKLDVPALSVIGDPRVVAQAPMNVTDFENATDDLRWA